MVRAGEIVYAPVHARGEFVLVRFTPPEKRAVTVVVVLPMYSHLSFTSLNIQNGLYLASSMLYIAGTPSWAT